MDLYWQMYLIFALFFMFLVLVCKLYLFFFEKTCKYAKKVVPLRRECEFINSLIMFLTS